MLQFAYPWLFLLLLLPVLLRPLLPAYREERPALWVPFLGRVQRLLGREGETGAARARRRRIQWLLLSLLWLALVTALARPQWGTETHEVEQKGIEVMVALDVSNSMLAQDIEPNRLERSKQAISKLIDKLGNEKSPLMSGINDFGEICGFSVGLEGGYYQAFILTPNLP